MSTYDSTPISQLILGNSVSSTDIYPATDITDLSESSSGTTKKYSISSLRRYMIDNFETSAILSALCATVGSLPASYDNGDNGIGATLTNTGVYSPKTTDGVLNSVGDRILVPYQNNSAHNGVYIVTDIGSATTPWILTRADDYDSSRPDQILLGDFIASIEGYRNSSTFWFMTSPSNPNVGVDPIIFEKQIIRAPGLWIDQSTSPLIMSTNTGYINSVGATLATFRLPGLSQIGDSIEILGKTSGLFEITQPAGKVIYFGTLSTTVGISGSISAQSANCNIKLTCLETNLSWTVTSSTGSFTVV